MSDAQQSKTRVVMGAALKRIDSFPPWVVMVQLFLGLGWLRAASEKLVDTTWWSGVGVVRFLQENADVTVPWYRPIGEVISAMPGPIAIVVVILQLVAGITLLTGRRFGIGLLLGTLMNLNFMAVGAVNPSAFYMSSQGALMLWLVDTSRQRFTASGIVIVGALGAIVGAISLPFIHRVDPMGVIEDPAAVLAYAGGLTVLACGLAWRRIVLRPNTREAVGPGHDMLVDLLEG